MLNLKLTVLVTIMGYLIMVIFDPTGDSDFQCLADNTRPPTAGQHLPCEGLWYNGALCICIGKPTEVTQ